MCIKGLVESFRMIRVELCLKKIMRVSTFVEPASVGSEHNVVSAVHTWA